MALDRFDFSVQHGQGSFFHIPPTPVGPVRASDPHTLPIFHGGNSEHFDFSHTLQTVGGSQSLAQSSGHEFTLAVDAHGNVAAHAGDLTIAFDHASHSG